MRLIGPSVEEMVKKIFFFQFSQVKRFLEISKKGMELMNRMKPTFSYRAFHPFRICSKSRFCCR